MLFINVAARSEAEVGSRSTFSPTLGRIISPELWTSAACLGRRPCQHVTMSPYITVPPAARWSFSQLHTVYKKRNLVVGRVLEGIIWFSCATATATARHV